MSTYQNGNQNDLAAWILVIVGLVVFPPVGLFLLFRQLMGTNKSRARQSRHPYDLQREGRQPGTQGLGEGVQDDPKAKRRRTPQMGKVKLSRGKGMTITGGIIAGIFGFAAFASFLEAVTGGWLFYSLEDIIIPLVFSCAGLVTMYAGMQRTKKSKRFRRYLTLIGRREEIPISSLAHAMSLSVSTACDDLQDMLDDGVLPTGYLDLGSGKLILSDEGLRDEPAPARPAPAPAPEPEPEEVPDEEEVLDTDGILQEIQQINDAIADPVMSEKIDRIRAITGKIFAYQKKNPGRDQQLRSFLSYYLPTTLRILKAYAQMEAQGVDGENIHAAKVRIEGMMDKVVEGYEKQLDKLFQDDAMDITTDVEVLERMLEKDGLSSGGGLTLGG